MAESREYHDAHLAFARAVIVEAAANREPLLDRLKTYTEDVRQAERDRLEVVEEKLRALIEFYRDGEWPSTIPQQESMRHLVLEALHPFDVKEESS